MKHVEQNKNETTSSPKNENSTHQARPEKIRITKAVDTAINNYIQSRKEKIPFFVKRYFSFKGSLSLHRKAIGKDLYRSPLNILWAVPYTLSGILAKGLNATGRKKAADLLKKVPQGFETDVQKEVKWLIYTELLELPCSLTIKGEIKQSKHDALLNEILEQPVIRNMMSTQLSIIHEKSLVPDFRISLEKKIRKYTSSRTAAEDLSGSILTLAVGYAAFQNISPGAISSGAALASVISQETAISNFWLGTSIGSWYYSMFPTTPSKHLFTISTASFMAILAIITTFSGILTDPLQSKLGLHQKRLQKLINSLHDDLKGQQDKKFQIKDQYVARVFDIVDLLKAAATA